MPPRIRLALPLLASILLILDCRAAFAIRAEALPAGPDYRVEKIVFSGNQALSDSQLAGQMQTKERPIYQAWQIWKKRPAFDPDVFRSDLKRLQLLYQAQGYFRVHIDYDLKVNGDLVTPHISIIENRPAKVQQVAILVDRDHVPPGSPAYDQLKIKRGQVFNGSNYEAGEENLLDFYRNAGYAHTHVERYAEINVSEDSARVWYFVQRDGKAVFGMTILEGNQKVASYIILRELAYHPGEQFSQTKLDKSRDRLLKLGLFGVVRFDPQPNEANPHIVPIKLVVRDKPRHELQIGVGYNTISQIVLSFQWSDMNFLGGGRQLTLLAQYSNLYSTASATLTQPFMFGSPDWTGILGLNESIDQLPPYTLFGTSFLPALEYRITEQLKARIGYRLEYAKLSSIDQTVITALGGVKQNGLLSGPEASLTFDNTDNQYNPTKGYVLTLEGIEAGKIFGGAFKFYRIQGQLKHYHKLPLNTILATRLKLGIGDYFGSRRNYPIFYRFFSGGEGSVRGYRYWYLGPVSSNDTPIGGLSLIEGSLELRHKIWGKLSGALFLDFGQVSVHKYDIPIGHLRFSTGPALSYDTPVGPVRIDVGFPFVTPPGGPSYQFYFSIGQFF